MLIKILKTRKNPENAGKNSRIGKKAEIRGNAENFHVCSWRMKVEFECLFVTNSLSGIYHHTALTAIINSITDILDNYDNDKKIIVKLVIDLIYVGESNPCITRKI